MPGALSADMKTASGNGADTVFLDALSLANEAGNTKALNTVMVSVLARHMDIDKQEFIDAVKQAVPAAIRRSIFGI